jgi:hypothetical protein
MCSQLLQHSTDKPAMMPLFVFYLLDAFALIFGDNGMPVATIGISRSQLG